MRRLANHSSQITSTCFKMVFTNLLKHFIFFYTKYYWRHIEEVASNTFGIRGTSKELLPIYLGLGGTSKELPPICLGLGAHSKSYLQYVWDWGHIQRVTSSTFGIGSTSVKLPPIHYEVGYLKDGFQPIVLTRSPKISELRLLQKMDFDL